MNPIVHLVLGGPEQALTQSVLERDPVWAAPVLWRNEFRNVLEAFMRQRDLSVSEASRAHGLAEQLLADQEFTVPPCAQTMPRPSLAWSRWREPVEVAPTPLGGSSKRAARLQGLLDLWTCSFRSDILGEGQTKSPLLHTAELWRSLPERPEMNPAAPAPALRRPVAVPQ